MERNTSVLRLRHENFIPQSMLALNLEFEQEKKRASDRKSACEMYRVINCKCNRWTLCHWAAARSGSVRSQFLISNLVTVFAYMNFIINRYNLLSIVNVVQNRKKTEKSSIFANFNGYLAFEMLPFLNALS